ncbi:MAG: tyrosine-type recombinase/integrase [Phenylobacterium sp.]|nr:tyrosine-type recombinase/integrase [Phenylobacterium sp.]
MATIDLEGVYRVTSKGRVYYYAWRGKGAPRLKGEPGSEEFVASLKAAHDARRGGDKARMSGLCAMFRASDPWNGRGPHAISAKTKASWTLWLDRIQEEFGELRIAQFDRPELRPIIKKWRNKFAGTPRAADMGLQVLSRLLSFGMEEGKLMNNICFGIPGIYNADRSGLIWQPADFARLAKKAGPEITEAAQLAALTGLRQSVLLRLGPAHRRANHLEIRSNKGRNGRPGKVVLIPLYAELRDFLDALPKRRQATTYLVNTDGVPWRTGFGSSWGKACDRADIEDLHFHDLRGTAATKFYLGGLSPREIAEIMGWSEEYVQELIDRYVKKDELILDRIRRLDEHASRTRSAKPREKPAS